VSINWGIVGCGKVADGSIAPAIAKLPDGQLVASVGSSLEKAEAFAGKHGGRAHSTFEELLGDDGVDVVYIATPNAQHAGQAIAAAEAGKHVLCDKPLATTVSDAERVVAACERVGVKLGVNFQTRHHEPIRVIKDTLTAGTLGEPIIVQYESGAGNNPLRGWRTNPDLAGLGSINNVGVHAYDVLRYLLDAEIDEVTAFTNVGESDLETLALALLRFSNGALAYVNANQAAPYNQSTLTIYGSAGRLIGRGITRPFIEHGVLEILSQSGEQTIPTQTMDAFDRSVSAFQHAVVNDEMPNASGIDGLRSVQLTDAMVRSAREGRTVRVAHAT
jgi:1,5-anhydro-D-fructose reductase (1,5-anhydro-D-mannitol-forming)